MNTRSKIYVGIVAGSNAKHNYQYFRSATEPTFASHGHIFNAVIGPFRTKAGAYYMIHYGYMNPHCRTVSEAEKLAKKERIS